MQNVFLEVSNWLICGLYTVLITCMSQPIMTRLLDGQQISLSASSENSAFTSDSEHPTSFSDFLHHQISEVDYQDHEFHYRMENAVAKKIVAHTATHSAFSDHSDVYYGVNVEEMIIYFLLLLLLFFLAIYMVRCVRTTLDPYNTVARVTWLETLEKRDSKLFTNFGVKVVRPGQN